MSGDSSQKVALVIGASRGIGRQVAIDLAHAGYIGLAPLHDGAIMAILWGQASSTRILH